MLQNQVLGMPKEPFSYAEFEETRRILIERIATDLQESDRQFPISFKEGDPSWTEYGLDDFENSPLCIGNRRTFAV